MHTYVYIYTNVYTYILLQWNPFQVNIYWLLIGAQENKRTAHSQDKVSGILSHAPLQYFFYMISFLRNFTIVFYSVPSW